MFARAMISIAEQDHGRCIHYPVYRRIGLDNVCYKLSLVTRHQHETELRRANRKCLVQRLHRLAFSPNRLPISEGAHFLSGLNNNKPAMKASILLMGCILSLAILVRLHGITFGLPAIYDPDEPIFVIKGLQLLRDLSLNPGWFGHPGTTTIYSLGLIDSLIYAFGHFTGMFANPSAFARAIYADPSIIILPGRIFIAICGVLCVLLTFLIGKKVFDTRIGLIAALLLAVNPLHIQYSQIIRTDVHATVFMLLSLLCSINIVRHGRTRDYLLAALFVGLACATKWPAATIIACPLGAAILRSREHIEGTKQLTMRIGMVLLGSLVALILASPYLVLDYQTVISNLHGEGRPQHLGATGHGFLSNIGWYLKEPLRTAIGIGGLILAAIGIVLACTRNRLALATIIPGAFIFFAMLATQALIWARWIVPLLPFVSLFMAVAIVHIGTAVGAQAGKKVGMAAQALLCLALAIPMALHARTGAIERGNDTRKLASAWARAHVAPGSTVIFEHFAFDVLNEKWRFLFPAGGAGCVDAGAALKGKIRYATIDKWRKGASVVNLGTIDQSTLASCQADYAIITHYDRYLLERPRYRAEVAMYERFMRAGEQVKTIRPQPGLSAGPVVRIVKLVRPLDATPPQ